MAPGDRSRWLLPLLLALSVALATALGMHVLEGRHGPHPHPPPGPPDFRHMAERMAEGMPEADGRRLVAAFAARSADFDAGHRAMEAAQDAIKAELADGGFDAARLAAALDGIRRAREIIDAAIFAAVVEAAAGMSPEGRRKLGKGGFGPPPPPPPPGR